MGVDLETAIDATLIDTEVCKIPSNANGPLLSKGNKIGGLLLGRSSAGIKGLIVVPGVIDADYEGKIYIMAYTVSPPLFVPKGSRIAQILAFENPITCPQRNEVHRGGGNFGSTGPAVCFTTELTQRPMECITLRQEGLSIKVHAMLDTGADITIINHSVWPRQWQLEPSKAAIAGVGGQSVSYISDKPVQIGFPEGQLASIRVHVLSLPGGLEALVGRDVLSQIGAVLTTKHF